MQPFSSPFVFFGFKKKGDDKSINIGVCIREDAENASDRWLTTTQKIGYAQN